MTSDYTFQVSEESRDPQWDRFVADTPGGHHVQTSLWAQVKAVLGWSAKRLVARRGDAIVAGTQILCRQIPMVGGIGYVSAGPLLKDEDPALVESMFQELMHFSRNQRLQYVVVQPPTDSEAIAGQLSSLGFAASTVELLPTASLLTDLNAGVDDLLAQMRRQTRRNIVKGQESGIVVREASRQDLPTFCSLNAATCRRQNATQFSEEYFTRMWDVFEPSGYIRIFVAEYEGDPVSMLMVIPFRDTVIAKVLGWSGEHQERRPNEAAFWAAIQWAKAHGYRWFDMEGINRAGAVEVLNGRPLPESLLKTPDFFKYGFGGKPVLMPESREYIQNAVLRWGYQKFLSGEGNRRLAYRISEIIRKR
jgi:lipid II:glycine glycyltransferase (peptidoglycan interpeptide bridge formation enzyme)